jgi:7-cyano-7-deazaguanine synthase in queuosine biosynthesis
LDSVSTIDEGTGKQLLLSSRPKEVQSVAYQLYQAELRGFKPGGTVELHVTDELRWDAVGDEIEELMSFLVGARPEIRFVKGASSPARVSRLEFSRPIPTVSLFSGGLDSGAFAVHLSRQEPYSILSHTETSKIIYGKARKFWSKFVGGSVRMYVSQARSQAQQWGMINTRGVVFLSNAMAIGLELGAARVVVPENGPMMLNLQVSRQAEPTKTANPRMIADWSKIVNRVLATGIAVETPYAESTKAEIISALADPAAMRYSYSCFSSQGQSRMCGLCLACFIRITSCFAVGQPEDVGRTYIHNPFSEVFSEMGTVNQDKSIVLMEALDFWASIAEPSYEEVPTRRQKAELIAKKWPVMRRHALDVLLGAREYEEAGGACVGEVGAVTLEILGKIGKEALDRRKGELNREAM